MFCVHQVVKELRLVTASPSVVNQATCWLTMILMVPLVELIELGLSPLHHSVKVNPSVLLLNNSNIFIHNMIAICQLFNLGQGTCSPSDCSTTSGSSVTVHCNSGYVLEGSSLLTCLQNGSWDKPMPHCAGTLQTLMLIFYYCIL